MKLQDLHQSVSKVGILATKDWKRSEILRENSTGKHYNNFKKMFLKAKFQKHSGFHCLRFIISLKDWENLKKSLCARDKRLWPSALRRQTHFCNGHHCMSLGTLLSMNTICLIYCCIHHAKSVKLYIKQFQKHYHLHWAQAHLKLQEEASMRIAFCQNWWNDHYFPAVIHETVCEQLWKLGFWTGPLLLRPFVESSHFPQENQSERLMSVKYFLWLSSKQPLPLPVSSVY